MKKYVLLIITISIFFFCACTVNTVSRSKIADIDFTVVKEDDIPKQLKDTIESKKNDGFMLTYQDGDYLYIAKGYGIMEGGTYCITVDELYLTKNTICALFTIRGTKEDNAENKANYIVVKCENYKKPVIFQ